MIYFEKSQPAPDCLADEFLKADGNYNCGCVLERLQKDFKNKCYLCESKIHSSVNIEHLKPHYNGKDKFLKFDWRNLFLACGHCNNIKSARFDNILNCTDLNDAIEEKINYHFQGVPTELVKITANSNDDKTLQTQELLLAIYNGTTQQKKLESESIRDALADEIAHFLKYLRKHRKEYDEKAKKRYCRKIEKHLNNASPFTAFKRQIIKDNAELFENFGVYF
jgi:hypothetical protein